MAFHCSLQADHARIKALHEAQIYFRTRECSELVMKWGSGIFARQKVFTAQELLRWDLDAAENVLALRMVRMPPKEARLKTYLLSRPKGGNFDSLQEILAIFSAGVVQLGAPMRGVAIYRVLVVINPYSGRRHANQVWQSVAEMFSLAGIETDCHQTQHAGHARDILRECELSLYNGVIAVGGDGTANEVLTGLLENSLNLERGEGAPASPPFGIIAAGTDCTLAKFISSTDPLAAARAIIRGCEVRPMDLLQVQHGDEQRYSACGVGWGIPGHIARDSESLRKTFGVHRYTISLLKNLVHLNPVAGTVRIRPAIVDEEMKLKPCGPSCDICSLPMGEMAGDREEEETVSGKFLFVACLKTEKTSCPFVHLADGCLDAFLVEDLNLLDLAHLYLSMGPDGKHMDNGNFKHWKAKSVTIIPDDRSDHLNFDGEAGEGIGTTVSVLPRVCQVFFAQ
uniref:DAGKc domain-containing protein n=1 Tax=Guillardia theta TaxID=55529 RepID=A0A6U5VTG6_GUITH